MIFSSRRFLVISTYSATVYQIPPAEDSAGISKLQPTWKWPTKEDEGECQLRCGGLAYGSNLMSPTIWVFDLWSKIHYLHLSDHGEPIKEHKTFPLKYVASPAITHSRAMCASRSGSRGDALKISTLSLEDDPARGSFMVYLEDGSGDKFKSRYAFDEASGRVALIVEEAGGKKKCYVYVSSIERLGC